MSKTHKNYITAQISLYPLGTDDISHEIGRFVKSLREKGLKVRVGPMSSQIEGESGVLFDALGQALDEIASKGQIVLTATFSNACPTWFEPERENRG